jgi:subtilisin family serine protease
MKKLFILGLLFTASQPILSQTNPGYENGWHLMDKTTNGVFGISLEKTYTDILSTMKPKKKVIVAVIDSGIDTVHEDLKSIIWVNKKEIPGNGKDDDKNGYVDDIHGWNFIGGKDGSNVSKDSYEAARVYYKFKKRFENVVVDEKSLNEDDKNAFNNYTKAKTVLESQAKEATMYVNFLKNIVPKLSVVDSTLKAGMAKSTYTGDDLQNFKPTTTDQTKSRSLLLGLFQQTRQMDMTNTQMIKELSDFYDGELRKMDVVNTPPVNYRDDVVKDKYDDPNDRYYGNNDVMGTDADHGTHVSGIIAAIRNNGIGINGVANNVEIMPIRTVPDGDEHDKDVANAIRYAVDNGAWVVNMSFGKSFSPEKKWVDEAVKYAESKGVLLIHAAGNDAKNIDVEDNFPSMNFNYDTSKIASNWMNIGASGATANDLTASFSNYGKREVSVFAPGVKIYSTIPGGNTYGTHDGTSMAAPVVTGLAALLLSYYPDLTAIQVKNIIKQSSLKINDIKVLVPGTDNDKVELSAISETGGVVNAYQAFVLASTIKGLRKNIVSSSPVNKSSK